MANRYALAWTLYYRTYHLRLFNLLSLDVRICYRWIDFPYLLALILLAIPVCLYIFAEAAEELRYRSILLVLVTLILTVGLTWISINMENGKPENKVKNAIEQVEDAANDLCTEITE